MRNPHCTHPCRPESRTPAYSCQLLTTCPTTLWCGIKERRMKRTFGRSGLVPLFVIVGAISLEGLATAGQQNTASIVGQVKDESGAILPGVTVTTKSPALQVPE